MRKSLIKPITYLLLLCILTNTIAIKHIAEEEEEEEAVQETSNSHQTWNGPWQVATIFSFGQCCYPNKPIMITATNDSESGETTLTANFTLPNSKSCQYLGEGDTEILVNETLNSNLTFIDATNGLSGMLNEQNMTMTWTYGNCYWYLKKGASILSISILTFIFFLIYQKLFLCC